MTMRMVPCVMLLAVAVPAAAGVVVSPREAIEAAMRARFGAAATVDVADLQTAVDPEAGLAAIPEPGTRTGTPSRFTLVAPCPAGAARTCTVPRGIATATVTIGGRFARTTGPLTIVPAVRAGTPVQLTVIIGAVHASGSGVAASSGQVGDVIGILPTPTRRGLRARITGPGTAEVVR